MKITLIGVLLVLPLLADTSDDSKRKADDIKRIDASAQVLHEAMNAGDRSIPRDLVEKAHCIGVIPAAKRAGFIFGGEYGKGLVTCRVPGTNRWTAPDMVILEGGNVGLQIGAGETDVIFAVMNQSGENNLMKDKFTIGGDVEGAIGPLGRETQAQTDAMMRAEMLSWSRSRGAFAGVTLNGASLRPDNDDNRVLYGLNVTHHELLRNRVTAPPAMRALFNELEMYPRALRKTGELFLEPQPAHRPVVAAVA